MLSEQAPGVKKRSERLDWRSGLTHSQPVSAEAAVRV